MKTLISGTFKNVKDAEAAINMLLDKGVPQSSISYVYTNNLGHIEKHNAGEAMTEKNADIAKDTASGAATGVITGGAMGALAGLAVVSGFLPGLGALFIAGPLAAALGLGGTTAVVAAGTVTGATAGGIVGALSGMGFSEPDAHLYEEWIKKGDIFLSVETETPGVREAFDANHADNIKEFTTA